ncbi:MAG: DNA repair protein RecO [Bacteroidota bacterium]
MLVNTKAIVLTSIKYGEADLIVKCYTDVGIKTYILKRIFRSKSNKLKVGYFQPLTLLDITANHNNKGNLNSIREARTSYIYTSIPNNIIKQTIVIFLSEVLSSAICEEDKNPALFDYISTTLKWLDTHDHTTNFHLLFLLNLTKHLGFYPKIKNKESNYFNLQEGQFSNSKPEQNYLFGENLNAFKTLIGTNFDVLEKLKFNARSRQMILEFLVSYYELHLPGFKRPKSLLILKEIYK